MLVTQKWLRYCPHLTICNPSEENMSPGRATFLSGFFKQKGWTNSQLSRCLKSMFSFSTPYISVSFSCWRNYFLTWSSFRRLVEAVVFAAARMTPGLRRWGWEGCGPSGRVPERLGYGGTGDREGPGGCMREGWTSHWRSWLVVMALRLGTNWLLPAIVNFWKNNRKKMWISLVDKRCNRRPKSSIWWLRLQLCYYMLIYLFITCTYIIINCTTTQKLHMISTVTGLLLLLCLQINLQFNLHSTSLPIWSLTFCDNL